MDTPQLLDAAAKANLEIAAKAIYGVTLMKQECLRCHEFLANKIHRLVELLRQAESRGGDSGAATGISARPLRQAGRRELAQAHDERDLFHTSPDELPVIDIHSL